MAEAAPKWKAGSVYWTELNTWEPETAAPFLEATLGWTVTSDVMADGTRYWVGMVDGVPVGGIFALTEPMFDKSIPAHWLTYFAVEDVDATLEAIRSAGGAVIREPFDVPGVGRIAIIQEPTGAVSGYMRPAM
ncbi:MAG: VOC family protein [Pseudomonadota bacterium]